MTFNKNGTHAVDKRNPRSPSSKNNVKMVRHLLMNLCSEGKLASLWNFEESDVSSRHPVCQLQHQLFVQNSRFLNSSLQFGVAYPALPVQAQNSESISLKVKSGHPTARTWNSDSGTFNLDLRKADVVQISGLRIFIPEC